MNKDTAPNKDIVYIDVEDDVTSVIGKVRASTQKIVALVPPKNIGALQSAVNLRLLQKAADNAGKRIVLITNNSGLTALAAGVKLPVAKNLQTKPEIPVEAESASDTEEDIIKGEDLPVGELAAAATSAAMTEEAIATPIALKASDDDMTIDDTDLPDLTTPAATGSVVAAKKSPRVPNFNKFRKWIFITSGLVVAIILFFVLMNVFVTNASVVITAQTSSQPVNLSLTLTSTGQTDPDTNTIQAVTKTTKKTESVTFTPTGSQNNGSKATGTVKFSTNDVDLLYPTGTTIPAGTELTSTSGAMYLTNQSVTLTLSNHNDVETGVTAKIPGASSNGASGSVSGQPDGVNAALVSATSGGTDNIQTVVTDADIAKAKAQLTTNSGDSASAKASLTGQFGSSYVIIGDSFASQAGNPTSAPASGQAATTAKLNVDTTYSLTGLAKSQIQTLTTNYLNTQMTSNNQKIYDDGSKSATISNYVASPGGVQSLHVVTTGKVGPNIDENALKPQLVGKKNQEIVQQIEAINGVKNVTVTLSPFWRTTAPSADKIKISFDLGNG